MTTKLYSTQSEMTRIRGAIVAYSRLPFSDQTIPGRVMESILTFVRGGKVLNTYDFVDVIQGTNGWQVKSTMENTPVTWKRAKIPDAEALIRESHKSAASLQRLGDSILTFCNQHVLESIERYNLANIEYARLIVHTSTNRMTYFERKVASKGEPCVFAPDEFRWKWSKPKRSIKKEQLPALHGTNKHTGRKWFAWHGLGENQLHFSGEQQWWPTSGKHWCAFDIPGEKNQISWREILSMLAKNENGSLR